MGEGISFQRLGGVRGRATQEKGAVGGGGLDAATPAPPLMVPSHPPLPSAGWGRVRHWGVPTPPLLGRPPPRPCAGRGETAQGMTWMPLPQPLMVPSHPPLPSAGWGRVRHWGVPTPPLVGPTPPSPVRGGGGRPKG
jgi:hypothetical protein